MRSVVLCADEESLHHPEILGLEGEGLHVQPWLRTFSEASEARSALAIANEVAEVWVASCEGMEAINLAAALKADRPDRAVFLVGFSVSGSLMSRAHVAGLDGVLSCSEFVNRYVGWKRRDERESVMPQRREVRVQVDSVGRAHPGLARAASVPGVQTARTASAQGAQGVQPSQGGTGFCPPVRMSVPGEQEITVAPQGDFVPPTKVYSDDDGGANAGASDKRTGAVPASSRDVAPSLVRPYAAPAQQPILARASENAFLLPVLSGSGGSGKSTIAALSAMITQRAGLKTLLLDLDLQFGDMREVLGREEALYVDDLLAAPARLSALAPIEDAPALLCPPRNLEQSEEVLIRLPELLDSLMGHFDVIVANTGSYWADQHAVLLERCSRALFVVDQRPSSLRACQRALDLCTRCGIAASPLVFAVNKCSKNGLYSSIDVSCALHGACAKELMWGGSQVEELMAAGQPVGLLESHNALAESLGLVLSEMIPRMPEREYAHSSASRVPFWRAFMARAGIE